nr:hypothetical protein [Tanacetum cinerariifolium]
MRKQVKEFVKECLVCQKCKPDLTAYLGLLQPLPIPQTIWPQISMDFIEGLPKSRGKDVIMVIVDRLSKYAYFIGLPHPFNAAQIAQVFLDSICKLYRMHESVVSDRDKVFISAFWKELFKALKAPPIHVPYLGGPTKVDAVDKTLLAKEEAIQVLKFHSQRSQNRIKEQADKSRTERNLFAKVGQAAYKLKLPTHAQIHNVFHVSQLKKYTGPPLNDDLIALRQCDTEGSLLVQLIKLLSRKMVKQHNKVVMYGLVQWANGIIKDASWEDLGKLVAKSPEFDLSS